MAKSWQADRDAPWRLDQRANLSEPSEKELLRRGFPANKRNRPVLVWNLGIKHPSSPRYIKGGGCKDWTFVKAPGGIVVDRDWEPLRRPCSRKPMIASEYCWQHAGRRPGVQAEAMQGLYKLLPLALQELQEIMGNRALSEAVRLNAVKTLLDRTGLVPGQTVTVESKGFEAVWSELTKEEPQEDV